MLSHNLCYLMSFHQKEGLCLVTKYLLQESHSSDFGYLRNGKFSLQIEVLSN